MDKPMFSLQDKVALVTGGAVGLGAGIAETLAQGGALVVVADINADQARHQAESLRAKGHQADWIALDVADEASVVSACREVIGRHGAPWLLVNNAGVQDRQYICEETLQNWDRTQVVNTRGPFLMTREIGRAMLEAGRGGRIVNIASAVLVGMIVKGGAAYTASKGALVAFSSIAALEFAEGAITVNTVLPGPARTPGTTNAKGPPTVGPGTRAPVFGLCEPHDIGAAVRFLASEEARFVTNQVLAVDAGFSLA